MPVAYFVQSHRAPAQVLRLLSALRRGSPGAVLVSGHCPASEPLDQAALDRLGVLAFRHRRRCHRGSWSLLEPYFDAVALLAREQVPYDWLVHLSGQDYPLQPVARYEAMLAGSAYDGYLTWRPAYAVTAEGRRRQGVLRYHYRYTELPRHATLLRLLRPFNSLQSVFHVQLTYGPRLGVRVRSLPFGPDTVPYVGSQWTTLRPTCAEAVAAAAQPGNPLADHFATTICPDEAFVQTVLVNDPRWRLCNGNHRFVDARGTLDGHPRTLNVADAEQACAEHFFARKFDQAVEPAALDWLDAHLLSPAAAAT